MSETSATRKAALWVGLVFLLGAALGGVLGNVFGVHARNVPPPQLTEVEKRTQKVQRLTQELNLTLDQQKQVEAIIASVQAQYKAIRESTEPQLNEARQRGREQMRAVLTPDQRPKFEDFLRRLDEERKKNAPK
jgi:Spy/CpxP family protein refolding chaperone